MLEQSKMHLEAALKSRATFVEDHYRVTQEQVSNLAETDSIIEATIAFTQGLDQLEVEMLETGPEPEQVNMDLAGYYSQEFATGFDKEIKIIGLPTRIEHSASCTVDHYIAQNPNPVGEKKRVVYPANLN